MVMEEPIEELEVEPLTELTRYAMLVKRKEYIQSTRGATLAYQKSLDKTIAALKVELKSERDRSRQLQEQVVSPLWDQDTDDTATKIAQLRVLTKGYGALATIPPKMPSNDSQLPCLIAARELIHSNSSTRASIASTIESLREARRDVQDELSSLSDAEILQRIFSSRATELQVSADRGESDDSHTIAVRLMDIEKLQIRNYRQDRAILTKAINDFVASRLAPLLAAEELGGPVTGTVLNITDEMLAAGFTDKGKVNKGRKTDDDHRQRRIDEMFGNLAVQEDQDLTAESEIAGQAMQELLQDLIDLAFDRGSGRYHELEKEDAASRYLVRSKVATLDPRDGRKIRLVDFGKPLDDWL